MNKTTLLRLMCASLLCACTSSESSERAAASGAAADAGAGTADATDATAVGPCCAPWAAPGSKACTYKRDEKGVCLSCCRGDACGYPPDPDGTCKGPVGPSAPGAGAPTTVSLAPPDVTTSIGTQPITVWVQSGGGVLPASARDVAPALTLKTYPELTDVPFEVTSKEETPYGGEKRLTLGVRPSAPLSGRWYVVGLTSVPSDIMVQESSTTRTIAGAGAYAARFGTIEGAVRRSLTLCTKGALATVNVEFSEAIILDGATPEQLKVSDSAGACDFTTYPPQISSVGGLAFACHGDAWTTGHVHVETGPSLRSAASGAPVGRLDPTAPTLDALVKTGAASEEFDFASVAEQGPCKVIVR